MPPQDIINVIEGSRLDLDLVAIGNALWDINDKLKSDGPIAEAVDELTDAIDEHSENTGKWLSEINNTLSAGFAAVVEAIAQLNNTQPPPLPNKMKGTIMADYQVPADQADGRVTFHIEATDSEGNPITDPAELAKLGLEVVNGNDAAFAVTLDTDQPDPANRVGGYHVGSPGQGTVTSNLKQADGDLIATGTDAFTVTTGEATLGSVTGTFDGLTPIV